MEDLSITLIQSALHWENSVANLAMFEEKIWQVEKPTDVIILPEMFSTGFSMKPAGLAEMMNQNTFKWMKQMASQTGALMIGSFIAKEKNNFFNRLLWMQPDGSYRTYDKRHLFRMADEHNVYTPGESKFIGTWKGWNIFPLVCYDLRFPVWSRNGWNSADKRMNYDVLIYVANWPQPRVSQWDTLLRARAIENLSYAVGLNRVGDDGNGVPYNGHSVVVGPKGEEIFFADESEMIKTVNLNYNELIAHRTKFPAYLDADNFSID
jgi:omega-amidase